MDRVKKYAIARDLPEYTVVPYGNICKKYYPSNKTKETDAKISDNCVTGEHKRRGCYVKKKILIVNKDEEMGVRLQQYLESPCTETTFALSVQEALSLFMKTEYCLVILDSAISMEEDYRLLKVMRKAKLSPILVLSSQSEHAKRAEVLQAGAHAYMGKPYTLEECLLQAQSLIQLYMASHPSADVCYTLAFGQDLMIDPVSRQVFLKGKEVKLTRKEFDLLLCLASNPGQVFTREQLYDSVWDELSAYNVDDVVKTHIKTVRQKLSDSDREYIKNVWGVGYRFHDEPKDKE